MKKNQQPPETLVKKSRHNQDRACVPDICKQGLVDAGGAFNNREVSDMVYNEGESGGALASSCEYEKGSAVAGGAFENSSHNQDEKICQISANKA